MKFKAINWETAETPLGQARLTSRKFEIIEFQDLYHTPCTLQQSSVTDDEHFDFPGTRAVWLGVDRQDKPLAAVSRSCYRFEVQTFDRRSRFAVGSCA